jgi:hypothetical protein
MLPITRESLNNFKSTYNWAARGYGLFGMRVKNRRDNSLLHFEDRPTKTCISTPTKKTKLVFLREKLQIGSIKG